MIIEDLVMRILVAAGVHATIAGRIYSLSWQGGPPPQILYVQLRHDSRRITSAKQYGAYDN